MQRKLGAVAIAALTATTLLGASAPAFAGEENSLDLITSAAPDLISEALSPASDAAGDLSFSVAGGTIHVPDDAGSGVVFDDGADSRVVGLPVTESATAISDEDGVRVYDNADDTLAAVAVSPDHVSMFTVIESASAPTTFSYSYEQYGTLRQSADDGGVTIWDGDTQIGFVYAPWALDANGTPVPTHYEVDGNTLTQVVDHQSGGFVYPIVADPTYTFPGSNSLYSRIVEDRNSSTGEVIIRVYVNQNVTGWQRIPRSTLVDNYNAIVSSTYERQNLWDQLVCHAVSVPFMKPSWNLETWRPNVGYAATVAAACNPT